MSRYLMRALGCGLLATLPLMQAQALDLNKVLGVSAKAGQALTLSDADIVAGAVQACEYMDQDNPVADPGNPYAKRLAGIVKGLEKEDGLALTFKVYLVPEMNAFAMANGCVRVYAGLMDKATDDEIRGVIGHEIGHVKLGHSKARQKTALLTSAARDGVALNGKIGAYAQGQMGEMAESVINAQFSQKEEKAVDEYGYRFMVAHKFDPQAMVSLFKKMPSAGGLTSTHPASTTRAKEIERMIAKGR